MGGLADDALAFQSWECGLGSTWSSKQNDITKQNDRPVIGLGISVFFFVQ